MAIYKNKKNIGIISFAGSDTCCISDFSAGAFKYLLQFFLNGQPTQKQWILSG